MNTEAQFSRQSLTTSNLPSNLALPPSGSLPTNPLPRLNQAPRPPRPLQNP
jgi:hypothetical protein